MILLRITFLLGWVLSIASGDSSGIKVKRDIHDPLLIHISGHGFGFENQFLADELALENAPPETANDPKTPGTVTKRDSKAARDVDIKWSRNHLSIKFTVRNPVGVIGASVSFPNKETFYGVWEYGFDQTISNKNTTYDVKGLYGLKHPGTDWASGRTPFFFTRSGLGFYIDTPKIGRFRFSEEDRQVTFAFNSTVIDYYVFKASEPAKLLEQYAQLSNTAGLPPNSGYGPIFWNNDWNTHWPEGVTNAEENYYHVADHLHENQIRATAMFADSKSPEA
jgi:alpha-glucosidase (family GH31 glycosyl hydrolase)